MRQLIIIISNIIIGAIFAFWGIVVQDTILVIIGVAMLINANTICFSHRHNTNVKKSKEGEK